MAKECTESVTSWFVSCVVSHSHLNRSTGVKSQETGATDSFDTLVKPMESLSE